MLNNSHLTLIVSALMASSSLLAQDIVSPEDTPTEIKPLWELGFGAGGLYSPEYPSSSEKTTRGLGLPYIVYRGDVLRVGDGQTFRAVAFENDRVELDLSFAAAFDSDSDDNELRQGMPDLDYLFQVGPQAKIHLANLLFPDQSTGALTLALQARGVFSTDLGSINQRGYVFEPMVQYKHFGLWSPKLDATISLKPQWASRQLHQYFFDVTSEFQTQSRSAYRSDSGYFGTGLNFYGNYRINEKLNAFFGVQMMSHHGAANIDSPLYEKDFTVGFGAGFIYKLFASDKMVTVDID
jgi:outer membrane scaffolding protein for murein synthesis (MipA/OmpV family)